MRVLGFLEYLLVFIGVVGMFAASVYYLPKGFNLGLFLVGAGIALAGLESIYTRRMSFQIATLGPEHWAGTPAMVWGWTILLIGLAVIGSAYLLEEQLWRSTMIHAMRRPGALLALLGLVAAGFGTLMLFAPRRYGVAWTIFVRIPRALSGVLLIAAGAAAVVLGAWEAVDPRSFTRLTSEVLAQYGLRPFSHYWRWMLSPLL